MNPLICLFHGKKIVPICSNVVTDWQTKNHWTKVHIEGKSEAGGVSTSSIHYRTLWQIPFVQKLHMSCYWQTHSVCEAVSVCRKTWKLGLNVDESVRKDEPAAQRLQPRCQWPVTVNHRPAALTPSTSITVGKKIDAFCATKPFCAKPSPKAGVCATLLRQISAPQSDYCECVMEGTTSRVWIPPVHLLLPLSLSHSLPHTHSFKESLLFYLLLLARHSGSPRNLKRHSGLRARARERGFTLRVSPAESPLPHAH